MATITLSADNTTLILNGHVFGDFVAGDILELAPVNDFTSHIVGANRGVTIQQRADGEVHDLTIRVMKNADDDIWMNSARNSQDITIFNGSMKQNFEKDGVSSVSTYVLENGSIQTLPTDTRSDTDGNALMAYKIRFRRATRAL